MSWSVGNVYTLSNWLATDGGPVDARCKCLSGCCGGHTCDGHLTQILLPSNVMKMRERERKKERD